MFWCPLSPLGAMNVNDTCPLFTFASTGFPVLYFSVIPFIFSPTFPLGALKRLLVVPLSIFIFSVIFCPTFACVVL